MANTGIYDLDKNLITDGFLDGKGSVSVEITNKTNPIAIRKITTNEQLGSDEFVVDNVEAKANASVSGITFFSGKGSVGFQASGDAFAELAVFPDPTSSTFTSAIGPISDTGFKLASEAGVSVVMLRWGADASVSGSGSIALGAGVGTVDFSAGAKGDLFFCVLRQRPQTEGTDDALASVVESWRLPVHVGTPKEIDARTHLLSELGGTLNVSVSATFGHEFNWVRQIKDGPLVGDIGLKLQLGLTAAFNLTAQGKYAVVVSRETEAPVIRVRIYKLKLNDFGFALSVSASATPSVPLPGSFDDLLKATLGVHAVQILSDLADPNALNKWIDKFGPAYVTDLLKKFTGLDLNAAITKIEDLANRWKNLPSSAASLFVKLAEGHVPDFSDIQKAAQIIANKDADGLKTFLEEKVNSLHSPLLSSPLGQYLEGLVENGALGLLQEIPDSAQQAAQKAVDFFKGGPIEDLLNKFVTEIDKRLGLDAILADLQGDPATVLDKLLFKKLEDFLGRTPVVQDIQKLQSTLKTLLGKVGDLYSKTVKALNSTYTAQLNATFQKTTTDTALIDASFDFSVPANVAGVTSALKRLLGGQLDDFLMQPCAGVTLGSGTLTHQVKRHSHVDLTLPFLTLQGDWISNATASFNAVDQNGGRLTTYQLAVTGTQVSKDTFTSLWHGRNWRSSAIAVSAQLSAQIASAGGVRLFANTEADKQRLAATTSSIRLEVANMSLSRLEANLEPFAVQFMRGAFPDNAAFEKWAATGRLLPPPATGNTLASLDVVLPAAIPLAWLNNKVADGKNEVYRELSLTLQLLIKRYLRDAYFRDLRRFETTTNAYLILLYAGISPQNAIKINGQLSSVFDGTYWDTADIGAVQSVAGAAKEGFRAQLAQAQKRLIVEGRPDLAKFYDPEDGFTTSFNTATSDLNIGRLKNTLLFSESNVLLGAHNAALDAAAFNALIAGSPAKALKKLTDFGNHIVEAFNRDLSDLFVADVDALQRLSPIIFAQAARVFDASIPTTNFDSILNVTVLKPGVAMPTDFPDFTVAPEDALVSLNAASFL